MYKEQIPLYNNCGQMVWAMRLGDSNNHQHCLTLRPFLLQPLVGLVDYPDDEEEDEDDDAATSPAKRARLNAS